jgi:hypothetical protein
MMTSELRFLLKTTSECEGCTDQESLCVVLTDLRLVADDLDLDFAGAYLESITTPQVPDGWPFCPCI